jgi:two-component SAPR family response regulator
MNTPEHRQAGVCADEPIGYTARMVSTRRTILIVGEDADTSDALMTLLSIQGYAMRVANERQLALDLLRDHGEVDVAIVELHMKGMAVEDFFSAARQIQPNLLIILVSSDSQVGRRAGELQAASYLMKPLSAAAVLSAVDTVIQRKP